MIEIIEAKIKQLREEAVKLMAIMSQQKETINNSKLLIKNHESQLHKINGAIEAFSMTVTEMKKNVSDANVAKNIGNE
jgi:hypothetical protein